MLGIAEKSELEEVVVFELRMLDATIWEIKCYTLVSNIFSYL